ncbi:MAG TPA: nitroreductase family protein [Bacteroidales bacterium]|nr:nitroreductase family protein [Bacteroidales bacterium]
MELKDIVLRSRSYRRFDESYKIDFKILESFIELARLSSSGGNRQPLKYLIFNEPAWCNRVFPYLAWASYLKEWPGPEKGERPTAYIIVLGDKSVTENFGIDHGICAQSIMLGATEKGLGGCMIQSIKREELRNELSIPDKFEILLVLAIGKPVEKVVLEEIKNNDVKYWRDEQKTHHVPKRKLSDLILRLPE